MFRLLLAPHAAIRLFRNRIAARLLRADSDLSWA